MSGQAEVQKRKKARRVHAIRLWVIAVTIVLGVAFVLLFVGYRHYLEVQDFSTRYDSLIAQFIQEDEFLVTLDTLMERIDDTSESEKRAEALSQIPEAMQEVEQIRNSANRVKPLAVDEQDEIALSQIIDTSDSRTEMLKAAQDTFGITGARDARIKTADEIWNEVISEGQQSKAIAEEANSAIIETDVKTARDKTQKLFDDMTASLNKLQEFAKQDPPIEASVQVTYIEAKLRSLKLAIETGDALIEGNRELSAEKNHAYNEADQAAADLAKDLPMSADASVIKAYDQSVKQSLERFNNAKDKVIATDALIRDYLSTR